MTKVLPTAAARPSAQPSGDLRRVLGLLIGLVMALMVLGAVGFLVHLRAATLDDAAANTAGVARLLEATLSRTLTTTDVILQRLAGLDRAYLKGAIPAEKLQAELKAMQASLPERGGLVVFDAEGNAVFEQRPTPGGPGINAADRPWFRAHAEGVERSISPMVTSRFDNSLVFVVSRRVSDETGRFLGVVSCGIHSAYFTDFYHTLVLGHGGVIAAATRDGLLLRQPNPELYAGRPIPREPVDRLLQEKPAGTMLGPSRLDGVERIFSYRLLPEYGIVVIAGMSQDEVLRPWWNTVGGLAIALALAGSVVAGLSALAFRGVSREQAILAGLEQRVRDRTEEAERRAEEARLANESKTRFLAAASHDLRQPLQAAGMFAEVLAARVEDSPLADVVTKLRRSIEATNSLLGTLLDVSALEAGKITPNISPFRLMPLLAALVDQIEPEATARGLSIGAVPTDCAVVSDPVLLERILRNLLINAVRYTETGGVRIGCRYRGDRVAIQVWDTGIGIAPDQVARIFDDFTRIEQPGRPRDQRGLGLGLGVVRRMAALLDHRLEVHSVPGRGSCFGVLVPRA
ncbi:ATP-binding protein [Phaeospirillum tilakii]|uniref:histidine kinase n=1 Tax=Phaeospirillum tilakii TaxID=741673 RepID=A0ABW5CBB5_9PROT